MTFKDINKDVLIHCKTQDEAKQLVEHLGCDSDWIGFWKEFGSDTHYEIYPNLQMNSFGNKKMYQGSGLRIVEFSDLIIDDSEKSVSQIIQEVCETVCDHLCKYSDTADDAGVCDYMREHDGKCPLDRLQ